MHHLSSNELQLASGGGGGGVDNQAEDIEVDAADSEAGNNTQTTPNAKGRRQTSSM